MKAGFYCLQQPKKYEWAFAPVLAKRLVSNYDTNLLTTMLIFEEVAALSAILSR